MGVTKWRVSALLGFFELRLVDIVGLIHTKLQSSNLFATSEPPKYSNSNSPNLCFDFFNDSETNNLRGVRKEY